MNNSISILLSITRIFFMLIFASMYLLVKTSLFAFLRIFSLKLARHYFDTNAHSQSRVIRHMIIIAKILSLDINTSTSLIQNEEGPFLILANHQSFIDIVTMYYMFPHLQIRFVAKKELGDKGFSYIALICRYMGFALIDRHKKPIEGMRVIQNLGKHHVARNSAIVIFPEGTRTRKGLVHPFHNSAIRSVLNPREYMHKIIVLAIDGGQSTRSIIQFLSGNPSTYHVKIVKFFKDVTSKNIKSIIAQSHAAIHEQQCKWRNIPPHT